MNKRIGILGILGLVAFAGALLMLLVLPVIALGLASLQGSGDSCAPTQTAFAGVAHAQSSNQGGNNTQDSKTQGGGKATPKPTEKAKATSAPSSSGCTSDGGDAINGLPDISDVPIKSAACTSGAAAGGCYELPSSKYYQLYGTSHTGTKCLASLIAATSKAWYQSNPKDIVHVGDMNAPGHLSHQDGVDVDISTDSANNTSTAGYSDSQSIKYDEVWFSTKNINLMFFDITAVRDAANKYAQEHGYPGLMQYWPDHYDHVHVRVSVDGQGNCAHSSGGGNG